MYELFPEPMPRKAKHRVTVTEAIDYADGLGLMAIAAVDPASPMAQHVMNHCANQQHPENAFDAFAGPRMMMGG